MAENKKSFVLYADLIHNIDHLTNEEKGMLFNHLLEYVNNMNPVLEDRVVLSAWKFIQSQLKRDLVKFKEVKGKRSDAGKESARLRVLNKEQQNPTKSTSVESVQQISTNPTDNDNDNVNDNVNDNDNDNVINNKINKPSVNKFSFKNSLIDLGVNVEIAEGWLEVRKQKKAVNSKIAFEKIKTEIIKSTLNPNDSIKMAVEKSWSGFSSEWITNQNNYNKEVPKVYDHNRPLIPWYEK